MERTLPNEIAARYEGGFFELHRPYTDEKERIFAATYHEAKTTPVKGREVEVDLRSPFERDIKIKERTKLITWPSDKPTLTQQKIALRTKVGGGSLLAGLFLSFALRRYGVPTRVTKGIAAVGTGAVLLGIRFGVWDRWRYLDLQNPAVRAKVQEEAAQLSDFSAFVRRLVSKRIVVQEERFAREGAAGWFHRYKEQAQDALTNLFTVGEGEKTRPIEPNDIGHYRLFESRRFGVLADRRTHPLACHDLLCILAESVCAGDQYYQVERQEIENRFAKAVGSFDWIKGGESYQQALWERNASQRDLAQSYAFYQQWTNAFFVAFYRCGGSVNAMQAEPL